MINLKKLFRRKKGQGALEYLFMIAAALIIIFVVVRYISGSTQQATSQTDIASLQSQAELARTTLQGKDYWGNTYTVEIVTTDTTVTGLQIKDGTTVVATDSNLEYTDEYISDTSFVTDITDPTLKGLYDSCMDDNVKAACYVLIDLQDATKGS
ncbi:MAG TPA: class III signal peptide-containing protein [Thermococcaceae archaeon]|nr:MAG: Uncharacterized protein XD61_1655 [Thermococcus sp. 40_45]HII67020.1 class III signal peptide-containing protein [Thermococcaceae archaeon]